MSDPNAQPTSQTFQILIDSLLESTLLQSFLTGLYTLIFAQAIVPLARQKKWWILSVLSTLYLVVLLNLVTTWIILRSVVVTNHGPQETLMLQINAGPKSLQTLANATVPISVLIADSFLVWRCYVLLGESKTIMIAYVLLLLGEIALLPVYLVLNITVTPNVDILSLYFIISLVVTGVSTSLITYRIVSVLRQTRNLPQSCRTSSTNSQVDNASSQVDNASSTYEAIITILVESGVLYTLSILITGILRGVGQHTGGSTYKAGQDFAYMLVPITGIAPTMMTARIAALRAVKLRDADKENGMCAQRSALVFQGYTNTCTSV